MIPFDTLSRMWSAERARRLARYARIPSLGVDGLSLGPMVIVAKRIADRWSAPTLEIDGCEKRILSLLAVAYWQPVRPVVIDQLRHASKALSSRNSALAPILMAQAGLGRIDEDERTAFRLFAAEKLLDAGVGAHELMKGLGLDPWPLSALKSYNPDEPRDERGRWTDGEGASSNEPASQNSSHPDQSPPANVQEVPRPDLEALAKDPAVAAAIDKAWRDSKPGTDCLVAKENGFYIVRNADGTLSTMNMVVGTTAYCAGIPQFVPPPPGTIAWFHTHPITIGAPFPIGEHGGYAAAGPSTGDVTFSTKYGIPGILKGSDGYHFFGPPLPQSEYDRQRKWP